MRLGVAGEGKEGGGEDTRAKDVVRRVIYDLHTH